MSVYVLVGASGAGKSTWAREHFAGGEIVSSDALRAVVGTGEADLDASRDAFAVLDLVIAARLRRGLTTVIDTLGLDPVRRQGHLAAARAAGLPAVAVLFDTPERLCRARNRDRDRPVPAAALATQLRTVRALDLAAEGWDEVRRVSSEEPDAPVGAVVPDRPRRPGLGFVLQLSRFGWGDGPAGWLADVALAAQRAGFRGLALMDHLIQIPQVGRAWEPIPEPWVTLGLLAGLPTTLELGTLVSPLSLHSPGRLAKAAATLDTLSGGRAFCGVGAGWWEREHLAFGLPFPPADDRVAALRAAIPTLRALWAPGTRPAAGLPETTSYPRPVGALPLLVGGRGSRVLQIAAELADGCNVPAAEPDVMRAAAVMAGKRVTVLDVPVLGRDRDEAAALVERLRGRVAAPAYARRHHAGIATDHIARYGRLAECGVDTVFLAVPDLRDGRDLAKFADVTAAFA